MRFNGEKVAFVSVVNDDFVAAFICMERTLRRENPTRAWPIIVLHEPNRSFLSKESISLISRTCEDVIFYEIASGEFDALFAFAIENFGTPPRLLPALYILKALDFREYDRIICIDSDILVTGGLDELLIVDAPFSAARAMSASTGERAPYVNTGVMVMTRPLFNCLCVAELVPRLKGRTPKRGTGLADQAVVNLLFGNRDVFYLPGRFNYSKRSLMHSCGYHSDVTVYESFIQENDIRVFHFVGEKPWNPKVRAQEWAYAPMDEMWHRAVESIGSAELKELVRRRAEEKVILRSNAFRQAVSEVASGGILNGAEVEARVATLLGM